MRSTIAATVVVATMSFSCQRSDSIPASESQSSDLAGPSTSSSSNQARPEEQPSIEVGLQRSYDIKGESDARVGDQPLTAFSLEGELELSVIETTSRNATLAIRLKSPKLASPISGLSQEFAGFEDQLTHPFVVEVDENGAVPAFRFDDTPSVLIVSIRRWIAAHLQMPSSLNAAGQAVHHDATGSYQVAFTPNTEPQSYTFKKLSYERFDAAGSRTVSEEKATATLAPRILESKGTLVTAQGLVQRVETQEVQESRRSSMLPINVRSKLTLVAKQDSRVDEQARRALVAQFEKAQTFDLEHPWRAGADNARLDEARIGGRSLEQLLTEFKALLATGDGAAEALPDRKSEELTSAFIALQAFIRQHPEAVVQLQSKIATGGPLAYGIIDAMGASGAEHAHAALVQLTKDASQPKALRKTAAISLSRTQFPTPTSLAALEASLDDDLLGVQAIYGLGTSIRNLRESGNEDEALRLLSVLLAKLATTREDDIVPRVHLLRAIANSGHEEAWPAVEPLLSNANEEVRGAAVEALQLIRTPAAESAIVQRLEGDGRPSVREAALRAARLQGPTPALNRAVGHAGLHDENPHLRRKAIAVLSAWLPSKPELRETLTQIAASEKIEDNRKAAELALKGSGDQAAASSNQ